MNELIETLRQPDFSFLFRYKDMKILLFKRKLLNNLINIYTLGKKYRKLLILEYILSSMIVPKSYIKNK